MTEKPRVETGPVMFEDDWPGIFIRGDEAFGHRLALGDAIQALEKNPEILGQVYTIMTLRGLLETISSCHLPMPDQSIIQKIWRGEPPPEPLDSPGPSDEIARQEPRE